MPFRVQFQTSLNFVPGTLIPNDKRTPLVLTLEPEFDREAEALRYAQLVLSDLRHPKDWKVSIVPLRNAESDPG